LITDQNTHVPRLLAQFVIAAHLATPSVGRVCRRWGHGCAGGLVDSEDFQQLRQFIAGVRRFLANRGIKLDSALKINPSTRTCL
jgi:hypothetical protein